MSEILVMRSISKEFPGVRALKDVTFAVREGEIHALCGENGAGKSTLMKILSGIYNEGTYSGDILIHGAIQKFHSVRDSESAGIAIIHQELSLIPEMTIGENIFVCFCMLCERFRPSQRSWVMVSVTSFNFSSSSS